MAVDLSKRLADLRRLAAQRASTQAPSVQSKPLALHEIRNMCERHGPWAPWIVDGEGVQRAVAGCPSCRKESQLRVVSSQDEIPKRFVDASFENFQTPLVAQARSMSAVSQWLDAFLRNPDKAGNLVMRGNPGTGKTHLAYAILKKVRASGMSAAYSEMYIVFSKLRASILNKATGSSSEESIMRSLVEPSLLILDEVGKQNATDFERLAAFNILNGRDLQVRPTIVISNEGDSVLQDLLTPSGFDRLTGSAKNVIFNFPSWRARAQS